MTRRYPAYQDSGVEWLGEVPVGWEVVRLKHACNVFPSNVDKHTVEGEIPVSLCNYTDVYYNEVITPDMDFMQATARPDEIDKFSLRVGDVIFTKDSETADDIGIAALVKEELPGVVCGYHLSIARPYAGVDGPFVKRFFDSSLAKAFFEVSANGLTRVGLGQAAIDNVVFVRPPLPEQTAISAFLDRETAKIDALVEEQRRLIDLLKEKRQAVISHAVTRGLNPDAKLKPSGVDWLGDVPEGWEVVPFKKVVHYQEGPGIMAVDFHDEGIPLMRISGVRDRWASLAGCNYLDPELVAKRWNHFRLELGDLVISASASMGTISEVGEDCVGAVPYTGLIRMKPMDGGIIRDFLRAFLGSDFFLTQIDLLKAGAMIQHFGPTHLGQIIIAVPPRDEQEKIVAELTQKDAAYADLMMEAEAAITLLQERRAALISAAVTGKIDVRDLVQHATEAA